MKKNKIFSYPILQVIGTLDMGGLAENVFIDVCNLINDKDGDVTALFTRSPGILAKNLSNGVKRISLDRK